MKRTLSVVLTIAVLSPPAFAALTSSAELQTDAPVYTIEPGSQKSAQVSFGSTVGLVIWNEGTSVSGTRVDRVGNVLDRSGLAIAPAPATSARLSCDHDQCLVVWTDGDDIKGARVSLQGVLLDTTPLVICNATGVQSAPAVGLMSGTYLVAWTDMRTGASTIRGARVSRSGTVLDAGGFIIAQGPGTRDNPAVAGGSDRFLVVWQDDIYAAGAPQILGTRVTPTGKLLDPGTFSVTISTPAAPAANTNPSVAWDGGVFWVASAQSAKMLITRVAPSNQLLTVFPVSSTGSAPRVACGGQQCTLAWALTDSTSPGDIRIMRFDAPTGAGLGEVTVSGQLSMLEAADITFDGVRFMLTYSGMALDAYDVFIGYVGLDGARAAFDTLVDYSANAQSQPAIAFNGTRYLVAWADYRTGNADIRAARFDASGNLLDPQGISVAMATKGQVQPRVAAGASDFLVVWTDGRSGNDDIAGARITTDGVVRDTAPIAIASGTGFQSAPTVASNGVDWAVLWNDGSTIRGGRVTAAGAAPDGATGIAIAGGGAAFEANPALARDGSAYVAAWSSSDQGVQSVAMSRLSSLLQRLDSPAISVSTGASTGAPALVRGPSGYVVAWRSDGGGNYGIRARTVSPGGVPSAADLVLDDGAGTMASADSPVLTTDGTTHLAAWQARTAVSGWELRTRGLDGSGTAQGTGFQIVARTEDNSGFPSLAATAATTGRFAVAYEHMLASRPFGSNRVSWKMLATVQTCSSGTECPSTFCVDGVCCDNACGGGVTTDCQACSVATGATQDGICGPVRAYQLCRAAKSACDQDERCDGTSVTCPADLAAPDGIACGSTAPCARDTCAAGVCVAATLVCTGGSCDQTSGACTPGGVNLDAAVPVDAGTGVDAPVVTDAGTQDSAGPPDAPVQPDAAPSTDGALQDGEPADGASSDGARTDAGTDGRTDRVDGRDGATEKSGSGAGSGCACSVQGTGTSTAGVLAMAGLLAMTIRRRRRR